MNTPADLKKAQSDAPQHTAFILTFISSKDSESTELAQELMVELEAEYSTSTQFITIDIDNSETAPLVSAFNVTTAPTFITVMDKTGTVDHIQGIDAPAIVTAVESIQKKAILYQKIAQLITQSKFVLFMKGTKDTPRCGFSRKMVALLIDNGVGEFNTFDILGDEDVRSGIKIYSNWPTFPQLYCDGELLGGLDVIGEMVEAGELQELLKE